ncbi:TetR/AcrR family transcriptional regulator [Frankia sp. AgB32]|uniref:TetR/AcrR family transcriptional regulator n=1 Tax=Frankia sp. AgB32 TaxID=631119 RepID=UPI00200FB2CA|nr:TetR/AcrR family transcriptional regulator [Frankia sp. AgB32]MCK9894631.1 TetR/AcrR family transcriptional regulator [Frankia sp. AgB32]
MTSPGAAVARARQDNRRLTGKGQATQARIIAAAARLLHDRGAARTSVEDVRLAAEVSSSQLYHYFTDKSALVRAVIVHQAERVLDHQRPPLGELDSIEALTAWRDAFVELHERRRCLGGCPLGSLVGQLAETDEQARIELEGAFERWRAPIRAGLASMRANGSLHPRADPDRLSVALLAALQGGLLLGQVRQDAAPLRDALDTVLDHIRMLTVSTASSPAGASESAVPVPPGKPPADR